MAKVKVLDGGFSTVVERNGTNLSCDPLWTASLLKTCPQLVVDVHHSYLASGSDIITTASYQASLEGFQKYLKLTPDQSTQLIMTSFDLADQARDEYSKSCNENSGRKIEIAGSIGPYGACLADGSEYSGSYCNKMSILELMEWHRPRMHALVEAGVDILAIETIPSIKEGEALMNLLREFPNIKGWLSFSCQSPHKICNKECIGKAVVDCIRLVPRHQLIAVGVNCCKPSYVSSLLKEIHKSTPEFPLIAYPNSGESWVSGKGWCNTKESPIVTYLESWIHLSVQFIGGCCRTGPEDIAKIVQVLKG